MIFFLLLILDYLALISPMISVPECLRVCFGLSSLNFLKSLLGLWLEIVKKYFHPQISPKWPFCIFFYFSKIFFILGRTDEIFDFSKKISPAGPLFIACFDFEKGTLTNFFGRRYMGPGRVEFSHVHFRLR